MNSLKKMMIFTFLIFFYADYMNPKIEKRNVIEEFKMWTGLYYPEADTGPLKGSITTVRLLSSSSCSICCYEDTSYSEPELHNDNLVSISLKNDEEADEETVMEFENEGLDVISH